MLVLSVTQLNDKLEYKFTHDDYKGIVFCISVNYALVNDNGDTYFSSEYNELEHTQNNNKVDVPNSKEVCDAFHQSITHDLFARLTGVSKKGDNSDNN